MKRNKDEGFLIEIMVDFFRTVLGLDKPTAEPPLLPEPPLFDRNEYLREHREAIDELTGKELLRLEARKRARAMMSLRAVTVPHGDSVDDDIDHGDRFYPDQFSPGDKEFFAKFGESIPVPHAEPVKVPLDDREWMNVETRRAMEGMRRRKNSSW